MNTFGKATFRSLLIAALVLAAAGAVSATSGLASTSAPETPGSFQFTQVSAGGFHTCGVRADGAVACWGDNSYGQSSPPAGVFSQVSAGGSHTCGVRADGAAVCWGDNSLGQSSPPAGVFGQVSAGVDHTCGVRADGAVACWGWNVFGQSSPPAGVFSQVSAGLLHTCGVRADGAVACWGDNYYGQSSPPPVTCADFDGSGTVDVGDLADIAGRWDQTSSTPGWNSRYDLFPTNRIDMLDLMWAMPQWGGSCS